MPVPGIRVHRGDHPVARDPTRDREHPVIAGLEVLAQHRGQQRRRLLDRLDQPAARAGPPARQTRPARARRSTPHEHPVIPVNLRLADRHVLVTTRQHRAQLAFHTAPATLSSPRIAERINVTVSIVATASYNGVESSTRRRPTTPAACAACKPTSKTRSGRC